MKSGRPRAFYPRRPPSRATLSFSSSTRPFGTSRVDDAKNVQAGEVVDDMDAFSDSECSSTSRTSSEDVITEDESERDEEVVEQAEAWLRAAEPDVAAEDVVTAPSASTAIAPSTNESVPREEAPLHDEKTFLLRSEDHIQYTNEEKASMYFPFPSLAFLDMFTWLSMPPLVRRRFCSAQQALSDNQVFNFIRFPTRRVTS